MGAAVRSRHAVGLWRTVVLGIVAVTVTVLSSTSGDAEVVPDDPGLGYLTLGGAQLTRPNDMFAGLYGRTLQSIFAGSSGASTCVIDDDHEAVCLGEGYVRAWGDPAGLDGTRAVAVPTNEVLSGVQLVAAATGGWHTCALDDAGLAYCWGEGRAGQLGTGGTEGGSPQVVDTAGALKGHVLTQITAGDKHTCALDTLGHTFCWGRNIRGQLGTGDFEKRLSPTRVDRSGVLRGTKLVDIDAGPGNTCVVDDQGGAYCWGRGGDGQLGNGSAERSAVPVHVRHSGDQLHFSNIEVGNNHTCALTRRGAVYCWGQGKRGRLGTGDRTDHLIPTHVLGLGGVTVSSLTVGYWHTCASDDSGHAWCWGRNDFGALGTGDRDDRLRATRVPGERLWRSVVANRNGTCGLDTDRVLYCWGAAAGFKAPGDLHRYLAPKRAWTGPSALHGRTVVQLTDDASHTCALTARGRAYCWGGGLQGARGDGTVLDIDDPLPVDTSGALDGVTLTDITTGLVHTCALDDHGSAFCWGKDEYGQLGNAGHGLRSSAVRVASGGALADAQLMDISAGYSHTCAIDREGHAYCWGGGYAGQLGNGTSQNAATPTPVASSGALDGVRLVDIEAGWWNTCALDDHGLAYCWGRNYAGAVGDGTTHHRLRPRAVDTSGELTGVQLAEIAASKDFACALDNEGRAYCWGDGTSGEMGDNTNEFQNPSPHEVDMTALGAVRFESLSASEGWVTALGSDGRLYYWGGGEPSTPKEMPSGGAFDSTQVQLFRASRVYDVWVVTEPR